MIAKCRPCQGKKLHSISFVLEVAEKTAMMKIEIIPI
jgi:hypothetical protein